MPLLSDVTVLLMMMVAALMTSYSHARALPAPVHYAMDEELSVGTALGPGQGLIVDAQLASFYTTSELSRLRFNLVRGPSPDLTAHYFTIDQRTGIIRV